MIVRPRPSAIPLFFILRGSVIPAIWPQIVSVLLFSTGVACAYPVWPHLFPSGNSAPFAIVGIALSVFLGFRNNSSYDRWWEGRRSWGLMISAARTFARQTLLLERAGVEGSAARARMLSLTIEFAYEMVGHLRDSWPRRIERSRLDNEERLQVVASRNGPDYLLRLIYPEILSARERGWLSEIEVQMLDRTVAELGTVQAACERIRGTPLPFAYTLLLHRTSYVFCFLLPFGLASGLGLYTPVVCALAAYTFFGLDALGDELEGPFRPCRQRSTAGGFGHGYRNQPC